MAKSKKADEKAAAKKAAEKKLKAKAAQKAKENAAEKKAKEKAAAKKATRKAVATKAVVEALLAGAALVDPEVVEAVAPSGPTRRQLLVTAGELGIVGRHRMSKEQLEAAVAAH